jgi:capsular polysaccharide biosynthesis protein
MSDQPLDLRKSWRILWRRKVVVILIAALGLGGGIAYALRYPALKSSTALVVLPPSTRSVPTQILIADSDPVLARALPHIQPPVTLDYLRTHVEVGRRAQITISITAQGVTAEQAENIANAVMHSYISLAGSAKSPAGITLPRPIQPAVDAPGTPLTIHVSIIGSLGLLIGLMIAGIAVLAVSKRDHRLLRRDDIADAIGIPVLASLTVRRASNPAGWTRLLNEYQPSAADISRMRKAFRYLDLAEGLSGAAAGSSVTVLTLSSDPKALPLGPQLAIFAASRGTPTTLVVGPQQDANVAAPLRAVCAAPTSPARAKGLSLIAAEPDEFAARLQASLSVVVAVANPDRPQLNGMIRTGITLLGVSAGAVTAEQLVRLSASAAASGRHLAGILVADPDPGDQTTGRMPQLARPVRRRLPTRMNSFRANVGS